MTAKPNLWVVLASPYNWIVHASLAEASAEWFAKNCAYPTSIVEYAPAEKANVVWSEEARRKFKCPRCECAWFRTPDVREDIVECKGCKYRMPRSECGLGKAVEEEEGK